MKTKHHRKSDETAKCAVAILAGGQGTRLASRSGNLPKPMVPILGKPVLQHQIELCRRHHFSEIALLVHHQHEAISDFFGDGSSFGVRIHYVIEKTPRGTAGALHDALDLLAPQFIVLYGDTYLEVDLRKFYDAHLAFDADATLFLHPNDHPHDSDLVAVQECGLVQSIHPYPHPEDLNLRNLVNAALYAIKNEELKAVAPEIGKADIAKNMFPAMLARGDRLKGYVSQEYIKDMGTPERLDKVERDIEAGLPEKLSLGSTRAAVFLDRDGTLIRESHHLRAISQVELLPTVGEAIQMLNKSGMLSVVITNQPVVARGEVTIEQLRDIHARMETLLGAQRAYLDAIYYCPHHPDKGFNGEVPELKIVCDCRKPSTGLINAASTHHGISLANSWMIGDTTTDIATGIKAGVKTILLRSGYAGGDRKYNVIPNYTATNLLEATNWILNGHPNTLQRIAPIAVQLLSGYRLVLVGGLARSGKSSLAQVLKESLLFFGKIAHVISLDGWLKSSIDRREGEGVLKRYDLELANSQISALVAAKQRQTFTEFIYDRRQRDSNSLSIDHSVGANDVVIIEGVPALEMQFDIDEWKSFKIYIESKEEERLRRMRSDYKWRGQNETTINELLNSRATDEEIIIRKSAMKADKIISLE